MVRTKLTALRAAAPSKAAGAHASQNDSSQTPKRRTLTITASQASRRKATEPDVTEEAWQTPPKRVAIVESKLTALRAVAPCKAAGAHASQNDSGQIPPTRRFLTITESHAPRHKAPEPDVTEEVSQTPPKRRRLTAASPVSGSRTTEFDVKKELWHFQYKALIPLAHEVAAKCEAVDTKHPRILKISVSFNTVSKIHITFRSSNKHPESMSENATLWSLEQMRCFVREYNGCRTSSGRRSKPTLTPDAIVSRCPSLWWSLVAWALGCRADLAKSGARWTMPQPTAMPFDMEDMVSALIDVSDSSISPAKACQIMQRWQSTEA